VKFTCIFPQVLLHTTAVGFVAEIESLNEI
jgi:hypothetical protein